MPSRLYVFEGDMEILRDYWGIILSMAGAFAWLLRTEGRVTAVEVELVRQAESRKALETRIEKSLTTIEADIKKILSRGTE